jgi:DNA-binding Lrp family transcriptional regulator
MIHIDRKRIEMIEADFERGMTIAFIARKFNVSREKVSNIRFEIDILKARKSKPIVEMYSSHDLEGEELRIYLGIC